MPEVEAFEDFHEQHGPTGGWHPDDHSEFEHILKACKGDYSHATLMCCDQMTGFKQADVVAHARFVTVLVFSYSAAALRLSCMVFLLVCHSHWHAT